MIASMSEKRANRNSKMHRKSIPHKLVEKRLPDAAFSAGRLINYIS